MAHPTLSVNPHGETCVNLVMSWEHSQTEISGFGGFYEESQGTKCTVFVEGPRVWKIH